MTMFNWFNKNTPEVRDVKDQIKESMLRVYYESPHRLTLCADGLSMYAIVGITPVHALVKELVIELGLPVNCIDSREILYEIVKHSEVTYPNGTKVGHRYYVEGEYLGKCAYSLYKTFFDNPKRFKAGYLAEIPVIRDTKTRVFFTKSYNNFHMQTEVSKQEFDLLVKVITKYYEDRKVRYEKLKKQRRERDMLRLYCTCEDKE